MTRKIDELTFRLATGHWPEQDDLERCNCEKAGEIGHDCCGWDKDRGLPRFIAMALDAKPA